MEIEELLTIDRIDCQCTAISKKRSLEILSELICKNEPQLTAPEVFETFISREKLGSTGFGQGVALPHGKSPLIQTARAAFVHLNTAVDFDAVDRKPVDLLFGLLVPEAASQTHLDILAKLAQIFRDTPLRQQLRSARDKQDILTILHQAWLKPL